MRKKRGRDRDLYLCRKPAHSPQKHNEHILSFRMTMTVANQISGHEIVKDLIIVRRRPKTPSMQGFQVWPFRVCAITKANSKAERGAYSSTVLELFR